MHKLLRTETLDPLHAVHSNFVQPLTLARIRTVLAVYALATLAGKLLVLAERPVEYVMFITNFGYYSLVLYLMVIVPPTSSNPKDLSLP